MKDEDLPFTYKLARFIARHFGTSYDRTNSAIAVLFFSVWSYLVYINHNILDLFIQPACMYLGYRLGSYGLSGLVPFGPTIKGRLYHKINYYDTLKASGYRWKFLTEEWFKVEYGYSTAYMYPGHEDSRRETTHVACISVTIFFTTYIFDVADLN